MQRENAVTNSREERSSRLEMIMEKSLSLDFLDSLLPLFFLLMLRAASLYHKGIKSDEPNYPQP